MIYINEIEKKPYLANSKYIGHIVEDRCYGATRGIICDDFCCEKKSEMTKKIIDDISVFAVQNISFFID